MDGISVTLSSGAATTTGSGGYYSFTDVEGGTYTVTISGYPADASFDATSAEVTIATSGQTVTRNFSGSYIRTASLMGMVTVEGVGLPGIKVDLSGRDAAQTTTDANGQYTFTGLRAGNYTVEISDFDPTDVAFSDASGAVTIAVGESKVRSFDGVYVRESTISGQVSVEGNGLAGVTVSLQGMGADEEQNTDMGGQFTFDNLRAGEYQVAISGYDTREYGFETTSATIRVEHGKTANQPFEGIMLRTASIMGQVSVEGEGLADVTVSLSGEGESQTTMTDNSGQYTFTDLPAGNFQVGISGYDTDDYSFETTSRNVSLALGATATVPFEGILLRTSGISGRVSVEGMGLDSVTVTLSGDDLDEDATAMTDASGQYAFAGLAEGDYTVAISGYDDVSYVFETTSMDVTLGDDDVQIHNFMGMHARTASVTVRLFVDEAAKNDMMDAGEPTFPTPDILAMVAQLGLPLQLPITLMGPGVLEQQPGTPMADGSVVFANLRAGSYQVVVSDIPAETLALLPAPLAAVLRDYAYGGPATGYPVAVGVGDQVTQNAPIDITHTTVHFAVNLKSGAAMGAALPGATVSFFSDMAGAQKIGDAMSGDNGMAMMRIARSAANNHTVYASVAAPDGDYHTDGMRQAVMWNAMMTMHPAANSSDIVNLKADFSFGGATIMTEMGGGKALGNWAISVSSDKSAAADTPDKLDAMGMGSYMEVVAADSLPVKYTVAVAGNQDNALDGGEAYKGTELEYMHNGLSLPATMDAGSITVNYTSQTLKVYVHHERDQVFGYTGNVLGGDERMSGVVDVGIRHILANGRSEEFTPQQWGTSSGRFSNSGGVVTFRRVPASAKVIVQAELSATAGNVSLLKHNGHSDELAAYTDADGNGIMGGAFGDEGGFHHTVELCPLMRTDPTGQRFGECGSFAYVSTYLVHGQVWKHVYVPASTHDGWVERDLQHVAGTSVSISPVAGENLAGASRSFTAASADNRRTPLDERKQFSWGQRPAGVYKVTVSPGWVANMGAPHNAAALGSSLNPLAGDLQLDVTPTTGFVYGRVTDMNGFAVDSVTVYVNGVSAMTDEFGRYTAEHFPSQTRRISNVTYSNKIFVETNHGGHDQTREILDFAPNTPMEVNVQLEGSTKTATIAGRVTASGSGAAVAGARIWVDYGAGPANPQNAHRTRGLLTDADGNYSAIVVAQPAGSTVAISATKSDMSFTPAAIDVSALEGTSISGISFTGFMKATISGLVTSGGSPLQGATVVANQVGGTATDTATTGVTGNYSLFVPFGNYDVMAMKDGYDFSASQRVNVGPGESKSIDAFTATETPEPPRTPSDDATLSDLSLSAGMLDPAFADSTTMYTAMVTNDVAQVTVTATPNSMYAAGVDYMPMDADTVMAGHQVDLAVGATAITATVTPEDSSATMTYTVTVTRANANVMLAASPNPVMEGGMTTVTGTVDVAQADSFQVTVAAAGGTLGDNAILSFAAGSMTSTGTVTVTAADNAVRNDPALMVTLTGTSSDATMMVDSLVVAVTDDERVASAPRDLTAMPGDQQATVTWNAPSQIGTAPITGYEWEATTTGQAPRTGTVTDDGDLATPLTFTLGDGSAGGAALTNGSTYTVSVHAVTALGDGETATVMVKAQPDLTIAATPTTILEAGTDSAEVVVAVSNPTTEIVTVTLTLDNTAAASISKTSMVIEAGTTADTAYVKAIDNDYVRPDTVTVTATADNANDPADGVEIDITNDTDAAPGAPGTLVFSSVSATGFTVEWTSPSAPGTSDITHYQIRYSSDTLDDDDTWTTVTGGAGARTHAITGLTAETGYNVEVRAVSAAGDGAASQGSQTTPAAE